VRAGRVGTTHTTIPAGPREKELPFIAFEVLTSSIEYQSYSIIFFHLLNDDLVAPLRDERAAKSRKLRTKRQQV
jgi:hypothetical protein